MACHTKFGPTQICSGGPYFSKNMDPPEHILLQDMFHLEKFGPL